MSIIKFIESVCVQDAIYWESNGPDGYGGIEFKAPVDIKCRWDEETQVVQDSAGKLIVSDAQLLVTQDLKEESMVKLGTVADLSGGENPMDLEGAFEIKFMTRIPLFRGTTFEVFQAFLGR